MVRRVFLMLGCLTLVVAACGPVDTQVDGGLDAGRTSDASDATTSDARPDGSDGDLGARDLGVFDAAPDGDASADATQVADASEADAQADAGADAGTTEVCPPPGACNVITNAGCSGGTVCALGLSQPTCTAGGTGGDGRACDPLGADCREGHFCTPVSRVCRQFCCPSDTTGCPIGQQCITRLEGTGVYLCTPSARCSPIEQTGCPLTGHACYFQGNDGTTVCASEGTAGIGESCSFINTCRGRLACVNSRLGCRKLCDPTVPSRGCAPAEGRCTPVGGAGGMVLYYVCVPPTDGGAG